MLTLAERPAKSIMTPRMEVDWLDIEAPEDELRRRIVETGHSRFPIARGNLENFVGVALTRDLLRDLVEENRINLERSVRQPLVVHESVNVLRLMEQLRQSPLQMAIVLDEYASFEGIVTPIDILEAIAGDFPDEDEEKITAEQLADGSWLFDGWIDVRRISNLIGKDLVDEADRYSTLAGYILWQLGRLPEAGERLLIGDMTFEIVSMEGRSIDKVKVAPDTDPTGQDDP